MNKFSFNTEKTRKEQIKRIKSFCLLFVHKVSTSFSFDFLFPLMLLNILQFLSITSKHITMLKKLKKKWQTTTASKNENIIKMLKTLYNKKNKSLKALKHIYFHHKPKNHIRMIFNRRKLQ